MGHSRIQEVCKSDDMIQAGLTEHGRLFSPFSGFGLVIDVSVTRGVALTHARTHLILACGHATLSSDQGILPGARNVEQRESRRPLGRPEPITMPVEGSASPNTSLPNFRNFFRSIYSHVVASDSYHPELPTPPILKWLVVSQWWNVKC